MTNGTSAVIAKLWNLSTILWDDGVTYHQYLTELTYLLFLKMAEENNMEYQLALKDRWPSLKAHAKRGELGEYIDLLKRLGQSRNVMIKEIYANASSFIKKPVTLTTLVSEIDKIDWFDERAEGLGDMYEGLLEKNANEKKSGAGQYFTPRPLIASMVEVMQPSLEDIVQDPAAGTGGFLISAAHYIKENSTPDYGHWTEKQQRKFTRGTFYGMEHVQDTHRVAIMNMMLHGLRSSPNEAGIDYGDTLGEAGEQLCKKRASLVLTNPPFGTKKGGPVLRTDFSYPTNNKQLCFLQHVIKTLKPGGRAAVVLPDNVLFESGVGRQIRQDLMGKCNLHTILRLPTGIFYAQGVKTNVLFFTRGETEKGNTKEVWVYDMRANMPQFGKRMTLTREHFAEFETAFGNDPLGGKEALARRVDTGEQGRFRRFTRERITERHDSLDISWLKDDSATGSEDLPEPTALAQEAMIELEGALEELRGILEELGEEVAA